jgi:hypothetical protein
VTKEIKVPDATHPISIDASPDRVVARVDAIAGRVAFYTDRVQVLAETIG